MCAVKTVFDAKSIVVPARVASGFRFDTPWGPFLTDTADEATAWVAYDRWIVQSVVGDPARRPLFDRLIDDYGIETPINDLDDPALSSAWNALPTLNALDELKEDLTGIILVGDPWASTTASALVVARKRGLPLVAKLPTPEEDLFRLRDAVVPLPVFITVEHGQPTSVEQALAVAYRS